MINKISDIEIGKEYYILFIDSIKFAKKCIVRSIINESVEFKSKETELLIDVYKNNSKFRNRVKINSIGIGSDKNEALKNYQRFKYEFNEDFKETTQRIYNDIKLRQRKILNIIFNVSTIKGFDNLKFEVLPWRYSFSNPNNQGIAIFDIKSELLLFYIEIVDGKQSSQADYILKEYKNIEELFVYDYKKDVFYKKTEDGLIISNYSDFIRSEISSLPFLQK